MSEHPHVHFEPSDVRPGAVARWAIVLGLTVIIAAGAALGVMRLLRRMEARNDPPRRPVGVYEPMRLPPEPQLQRRPADDLAREREQQRARLEQGGPDPQSNATRLRIEDAMKLWVERQAASSAPASPAAASPVPAASPRAAASMPTESAPAPTLPHEPGGPR